MKELKFISPLRSAAILIILVCRATVEEEVVSNA